MRACPSCAKSYPDAVFFCGEDGSITIQEQPPGDVDSRLGKQLGGYIVVARVADGAMGRVYEGRHPTTKARVAIKVLHAHVAKDAVANERFKREYETALELNHEHVVKVHEFGATDDRSSFLTMEYLEGEELGRVLGNGKSLPPARALRVLCQVALALEHAHSFGFIHRDLKPENVFLCRSDNGDSVRILDFGSVKLQLETGAKLTAIGTTVGSPFYMSPEQAMGRADVDGRSDEFALAAILYEMLTGRVAFEAPNLAKILMRIMHEMPEPPAQVNPTLPRAIDDVIEKALAKSKEQRYPGALAFAEAALDAFGVAGKVAEWAERPLADREAALAAASAAPKAATTPARAQMRLGESSRGSREDATAPKILLGAGNSDGPKVMQAGANSVALLWLAVGLVITLIGGAALLLR
jgi:serine/threonine protein kinase